MYRIAVLQNQSEAFELSYGDVYSWFTRIFPEYKWDLYSSENSMADLFVKINDDYYDAIIFTTNTFNDIYLKNCWWDKNQLVNRFLEKGKGVLILQQLKIADDCLSLMPENLQINILKRPGNETRDSINEKLFINNSHIITEYPNKIDAGDVLKICLQNSTIEYVYWCYLIPKHPEYWTEVIYDDSHDSSKRSLLLVSGPQTPGRVVLTSMVLDWQRQYNLLRNILTYVIEGKHNMAVIRKVGKSSYDFEYLLRNLRIAKYPFREYIMDDLDFSRLAPQMHNIAILDPAWSQRNITKLLMDQFCMYTNKEARLILFDMDSFGLPSMITIGGILKFKTRYYQAINFLKDSFDRKGGRWDGSYFSTTYILNTLKSWEEPVDEYVNPFLDYIAPHDLDGSYDRQFATTCALLQVYYSFLGNQHSKYRRTIEWLQTEIQTERKSIADLARAYFLFHECKIPLSHNEIESLYSRIILEKNQSDEEIYRYIKLFLAYDLIEELTPYTLQLISLQRDDGSWGYQEKNRLFFTALVIDLLIAIKDITTAKGKNISGIEESILNGIIYLKSFDLITLPSKDKASTIAAVLQALRHFESKINFPMDEFLQEHRVVIEEYRINESFNTANHLISALQVEKVRIANTLDKTLKEVIYHRKVTNRMGYTILICLPLLAISVSLLVSLAIKTSLGNVLEPLLKLDLSWSISFLVIMLIIFGLMIRRRLLPKQLKALLKMTADILSTPGKIFEDVGDDK